MKVRFAVAPHSGPLSVGDLLAFADAVEVSGFDGVWLSDLPISPAPDPLLSLALIAGRTSRLRLGANVVPLGHNPYLLAKSLAQLDHLGGGRLLLSFVTGIGRAAEAEALGLDGAGRGEALEETLGLLRSWWAGETVDHHSTRWSFTALPPSVRPVQDPLEVWLGGRGPKALDRVGRIGDGWLGSFLTCADAATARERIQASAARAAREMDPEHFGMSVGYCRVPPEPGLLRQLAARRPDADPLDFLGVGEQGLRALIEGYVEAGLSKFVVRPVGPVSSWQAEAEWLATAILHLQT